MSAKRLDAYGQSQHKVLALQLPTVSLDEDNCSFDDLLSKCHASIKILGYLSPMSGGGSIAQGTDFGKVRGIGEPVVTWSSGRWPLNKMASRTS